MMTQHAASDGGLQPPEAKSGDSRPNAALTHRESVRSDG